MKPRMSKNKFGSQSRFGSGGREPASTLRQRVSQRRTAEARRRGTPAALRDAALAPAFDSGAEREGARRRDERNRARNARQQAQEGEAQRQRRIAALPAEAEPATPAEVTLPPHPRQVNRLAEGGEDLEGNVGPRFVPSDDGESSFDSGSGSGASPPRTTGGGAASAPAPAAPAAPAPAPAPAPKKTSSKSNMMDNPMMMAMMMPMMMNGGMHNAPINHKQMEELEEERKETEKAIQDLIKLMESLKELQGKIKEDKKSKMPKCDSGTQKMAKAADAIRQSDVIEALNKCKRTLKKYKDYLGKLHVYSVYLQRLTKKIQTRMKYNIKKTARVCGKKNKSHK